MQKVRLLSTVAAALLLTAGTASAQSDKKGEAAAPAPAVQQKAPAEKTATPMNAGQKDTDTQKSSQSSGQAPSAADAGKTRATDKAASDKDAVEKSAPKAAAPTSPSTKSAAEPSSTTTTGQGSAAGAVKLSTEQRTKITTVLKQQKVEPAKLNISIRIGTRVPESVRFYPLPQEVYVIYPEWRGFDYILVGNEILIINPRTHEIVAILDV